MKKLLITAIALATVAAVTKAKSKKEIKTLREWRKDPRYKKPEATAQNIKINLDPLIRAEKELENLRSQIR